MKAERQRRIVQILGRRAITSQAQLARLLLERGERVTQATLSRDLEELGAYKARTPDGTVAYRLPEEPAANAGRLRRMLVEFVTDVESSGNLVVVRTPPGGADPVARAIDTEGIDGVLGTVAGDDTILVVCRGSGGAVARRIRRLAGQFDDDIKEA